MSKAFIIGILCISISFVNLNGAEPEDKRPNFLQILTDDQGWGDLGSYGHVFMLTPHIDQLASEGMKFTHCYSAAAVCSPSRAAILTGRTPFRNGVFRWIPAGHFSYLPDDEITLPQLLRSNGYQTAHFGKWHLSNFTEERINGAQQFNKFGFGTDPDQPDMNDYGYDYWFATGNVARPSHKNPLNFFLNGKAMGMMEGYSAQIVAAELVKWLREYRTDNKPFFITLWFHEPHGPIESDPKFIERYPEVRDPSFQQYLANVTQIDEAVGEVVKVLKEEGIYDETMIWYTSDNGPEGPHEYGSFNNENRIGRPRYRGSTGGLRGRKRFTHEGGIRVPGIISWPEGFKRNGIKSGSLTDKPIIGSDIFPTMLEIAGITPPADVTMDGSSVLPILENREFHRNRPLYWRNNRRDYRIALRQGHWKIIARSDQTGFELYNLVTDPRETTDQSTLEPEVFERLKKELIEYDNEVLEEGPDWWKEDPGITDMPPASDRSWANRLEYVGLAVEEPGYHVWGSSPVVGPEGKTHLFVSRWPVCEGFGAWLSHCEIARYVSDNPEGPFVFQEVVLKGGDRQAGGRESPHNPTIQKVGDKYVLCFITNAGGERKERRVSQAIGMLIADSPEGPWKKAGKKGLILSTPEDPAIWSHGSVVGVNNPALLAHPDGRYFLYYKAMIDGDVRRMGVAIADKLEGPYIFQNDFLTSNTEEIEDGYAFAENGKICLLTTHNIAGTGYLWQSEDGIQFDVPIPGFDRMDNYLPGESIQNALMLRGEKFERPQVLMQHGKPTHLYLASGMNFTGGKGSCSCVLRIHDSKN